MTASAWSAPGKLMLFGEYAVLEGHPSLALCFDARMRCAARAGGGDVRFDAPELLDVPVTVPMNQLGAGPPRPELRLLWPLILDAAPALGGLSLRFDSEFPPTWGLGSSSASTLAAVAAVRSLLGDAPPPRELFEEAHGLHLALQGAASGYDIATQLVGGCALFQDGRASGGLVHIQHIVTPPLEWMVAYTGTKASTSRMIGSVRAHHPVGAPIYARIGALAGDALALLESGDAEGLGAAMNRGQDLLTELGAVPEDLGAVVRVWQQTPGVHGARMCGAGGGDCVLLLVADEDAARGAVEASGFEVLPLRPTLHGLRKEPLHQESRRVP